MTKKPEFYKFRYAFRRSWTFTEAVRLLIGQNPSVKLSAMKDIEKAKVVREELNHALRVANIIDVVKVVAWPPVPGTEMLYRAKDIARWARTQTEFKPDQTFLDIHDWAHGKLFNPTKRGAYNNYFYQSCAIALWKEHKDISKPEMAEILFQLSDDIRREFKVDFRKVRPFTIKGYLDEINNDRRPRRPPKRALPEIPISEILEILRTK